MREQRLGNAMDGIARNQAAGGRLHPDHPRQLHGTELGLREVAIAFGRQFDDATSGLGGARDLVVESSVIPLIYIGMSGITII